MAIKWQDNLTPEGKKFLKEIEKLAEMEVAAGFQHGEASAEDGTDICDIAAWNELGTENSPSRPFMRMSVDDNESGIVDFLKNGFNIIAGGGTAEQVLKEVGVFQKGLVQETIVDGSFAANAPATVKKKGSDRPLIDTGRMRQSVNYVVRKKGSQ